MTNKNIKQFARDYANRINGTLRRETLRLGLAASILWSLASVGVYSVMAINDTTRYGTNFKTEFNNTMSDYGDSVWIVAIALLVLALGSSEFKYAIARREAQNMIRRVTKQHFKHFDDRNIKLTANYILQTLSDAERNAVMNAGVALRAEIDKYIAESMNLRLTSTQRHRLTCAAIIKFQNDVIKIVENSSGMQHVEGFYKLYLSGKANPIAKQR